MNSHRCHCYDDLEGEGFFDYIKNIFNPTKSMDTEKYLEKYGNYTINEICIYRTPVQKILQKILNLISVGQFEKEKKKLNYDDVFHLYTIIKLENNGKTVYIRIEKQPNIVIAEQKNFLPVEKGGEMLHVVLDRPVLFANVLNIAKETMGDEYYKYSNPYNNCQTFIFNLVSAMYKLNNQTLPENLLNFILQNVEDAVKGTTRNVSNFVTNLGHFFGRIMGHGLEGGTLNEDNSIIHYYRGF